MASEISVSPNGKPALGPNDVGAAAEAIRDFVVSVGQATKKEVRDHCASVGVGTDLYQKGFARIYGQLKMLTEVGRDDGTKAYELKRNLRPFSVAEWAQQLEEASGLGPKAEKYGEWYAVTGALLLTGRAYASQPVLGNPSARVFARTWAYDPERRVLRREAGILVLLESGYFRAMFRAACREPGAPKIGSASYQVRWGQQVLPEALVEKAGVPVPPDRPGATGKGLIEVEVLPIGTAVPFRAIVPGSHVSFADFLLLLSIAGQHIGFSPSGAHLGRGRFVPIVDPVAAPPPSPEEG